MITDFLLEHSALVPVTLILIPLACAGLAFVLVSLGAERFLPVVAGASLIPIVALTLVPGSTPVDGINCTFQFVMPRLGSVELLANIALLFPAVYFTALATKRPVATFAAGVALSAGVEATQALIPALSRSCDTGDWAMNCLGALAAAVLAAITLAIAERSAARGRHSPSQPVGRDHG